MSVKRVFMLNKPKWPWIVAGFIGSAANGVVMPLFALVFAEMMQLFFEPDIQTMRDDGIFFALMFLVVAVGAGEFSVSWPLSTMRRACAGAHVWLLLGCGRAHEPQAPCHGLRRYAAQGHGIPRPGGEQHWCLGDQACDGCHSRQRTSSVIVTAMCSRSRQAMATERTALTIQNLVTVATGLVLAFKADWRLTLVVLACGPVIVFASALQMKVFTGQTASAMKSLEGAGHVVQESVHGVRTVAAFNLNSRLTQLYASRLTEPMRLGVKGGHTSGFGFGFSQFVMLGAFGLAFFIGGLWVDDGTLTFCG